MFLVIGCGSPQPTPAIIVPTQTALLPTSTALPTSTPFPTPTPVPNFESSIPSAGPLCDIGFASPVVGGSPVLSLLTLIEADGGQSWTYDKTLESTDLKAQSLAEVHTLACIKEEVVADGTYLDGSTAYSRTWDVRLIGYPDGRVFNSIEFDIGSPFFKDNTNNGIAPRPVEQLSLWLMGLGHNTILHLGDFVYGVAFAPDGKTLVSRIPYTEGVQLWDVSKQEVSRSLDNYGMDVLDLTFSPDGMILALASFNDNQVVLLDVSTGKRIRTISAGTVRSTVFSPDGKTLATSSENIVNVWNLVSGQRINTFNNHSDQVQAVVFSPDGKTVASGDVLKTILLWDVSTRRVLHKFDVLYEVDALAFSPDGKMLAANTDLGKIIIWDVASGKPVKALSTQAEKVGIYSLAFSLDGKTLAAGLENGSVQLWQIDDGGQFSILGGLSGHVETLAFLTDGQTLAAADSKGTAILWNIQK